MVAEDLTIWTSLNSSLSSMGEVVAGLMVDSLVVVHGSVRMELVVGGEEDSSRRRDSHFKMEILVFRSCGRGDVIIHRHSSISSDLVFFWSSHIPHFSFTYLRI